MRENLIRDFGIVLKIATSIEDILYFFMMKCLNREEIRACITYMDYESTLELSEKALTYGQLTLSKVILEENERYLGEVIIEFKRVALEGTYEAFLDGLTVNTKKKMMIALGLNRRDEMLLDEYKVYSRIIEDSIAKSVSEIDNKKAVIS